MYRWRYKSSPELVQTCSFALLCNYIFAAWQVFIIENWELRMAVGFQDNNYIVVYKSPLERGWQIGQKPATPANVSIYPY